MKDFKKKVQEKIDKIKKELKELEVIMASQPGDPGQKPPPDDQEGDD